ncbi:MAG: cyclic nucleotide-binding domain-containing protein [Vulcanimicrobiota bacterium]
MQFLIVTHDAELAERSLEILGRISSEVRAAHCPVWEEALDVLRYDLPEIVLIDCDDTGVPLLLSGLQADPWLHSVGILAIHRNPQGEEFRSLSEGANILAAFHPADLPCRLPIVAAVLLRHRHLVFQRDLQQILMPRIAGLLEMESDPFQVGLFASLVSSFLFHSDFIGASSREEIRLAITELLMNAVEHGNCGITYNEKTAFLNEGGSIDELISLKLQDPAIAHRHVSVSYHISPEESSFTISDGGAGFDWRSVPRPVDKNGNLLLHGRGIQIASSIFDSLFYNEKGNEVTFCLRHRQERSNLIPGLFEGGDETLFRKGDTVFLRGDASSHLYYIVSGSYGVYSQRGRLIAILEPSDLFLGEMSFLLRNRRTATVKARSDGALIKVSKKDFMNAVRERPYYGILLARLLAARIEMRNMPPAPRRKKEKKCRQKQEETG